MLGLVVKYMHLQKIQETMTEILPLSERYRESVVGVNRYRWFGCSLSRVGLVKAQASNETRLPPLQGKTLIGVLSDFPFGG